ncbi:amino acid adenylation domain-containing protein [Nocardia panacis]|uniref:Phenyloxazoline synthase MbtB n=1 Tax=Nocardia panacis TaxID=2340916 RepID=A0A3A4KSE8_9NOCA|nr:non-ribosomal peptide synthetase [Nocardia panacis]RJO78886.1 amino acid adenylation domain-containing protein [Nocardia panacis]
MESQQHRGPIGPEEIRAAIADQLGLGASEIADDADLIQLGLDSIRTMKLAGGWRKRGAEINFAQLAASPSVAEWIRLLGAEDAVEEKSAESARSAGDPVGAERAAREPESAGAEFGSAEAVSDSVGTVVDSAGAEVDSAEAEFDEFAPYPMAGMQHAYWIGRSDEQDLGGVAAHLYVEFDGAGVDPERLRRAVGELVAAHPMLRTRFRPDGTQQTMSEPGRPVFAVVDLRGRADAESELDRLRDTKTHQRLSIEDGQVLDITLTLLDGERTRLHLDVDMLAGDAMSYRVLIADLAARYGGGELPVETYSYRRYRTRSETDPEAWERDRRWWRDRLPELPGAPELPTIPVAERVDPQRTVRYNHWLAPQAKQRLLAAAHARAVTPAMALAAVFAETIGGWSARSRFLLNVPLFHREPVHPDIDRVIGDFTSSVMLDIDVSADVTVTERARVLQRTMHECGAHTAYSGLEVLRDLGRLRGEPVLAPIVYTSALNLGELFADAVTETFGTPEWIISQGPQVLLDAQVTEVRGGLLLNWDVRESAFPAGMIEAMFACYTEAIGRLGAGEAGWEAEAAVRLPVAQAAVRTAVNATEGPVSGRVLHQGLFDHAAAAPDSPAVRWTACGVDGGWTYGELAAQALSVAGALREAGVRPGETVAVQLPKGPDQILAVLGVLAAGAAYVPIGFDQPVGRRAEILRTGDVVAALTVDGADQGRPEVICIPMSFAANFPNPMAAPILPDPEAIAYVLFTSGSTGVPKGVDVPHRAAMNTIDAVNDWFGVGPADRVLGLSALEFDASVYDMFGMFAVGGSVVALNPAQREEATDWVELLVRHRVSILNCVPSMLDMILEIGGDRLGDSLRAVTLGGDWVGAELARRLARQVPGCRFSGLGGATETAIHNTICEVAAVPEHWATVPFGVPLRNVRCRVVNSAGRDCPDWVPGEFWVGGANVAAGYRNDPERTAERFVAHDDIRWYRTGDMARYWPDGTIEFLGRADHQVQIRGYRVELGEVESALRTAPGVRHAVAAVVDKGAPKLVAAVAGADGAYDAIVTSVRDLLPGYMIPTRILTLERMPLTDNGKLDRRAVLALLESAGESVEEAAPSAPLEQALAAVITEVLGRDALGAHEDFFALGGDSVLATTAVARVREWLDVPHALVADLLVGRTVAGLARRLLERERALGTPDRLDAVAELYLEVAAMSDEEVLAEA